MRNLSFFIALVFIFSTQISTAQFNNQDDFGWPLEEIAPRFDQTLRSELLQRAIDSRDLARVEHWLDAGLDGNQGQPLFTWLQYKDFIRQIDGIADWSDPQAFPILRHYAWELTRPDPLTLADYEERLSYAIDELEQNAELIEFDPDGHIGWLSTALGLFHLYHGEPDYAAAREAFERGVLHNNRPRLYLSLLYRLGLGGEQKPLLADLYELGPFAISRNLPGAAHRTRLPLEVAIEHPDFWLSLDRDVERSLNAPRVIYPYGAVPWPDTPLFGHVVAETPDEYLSADQASILPPMEIMAAAQALAAQSPTPANIRARMLIAPQDAELASIPGATEFMAEQRELAKTIMIGLSAQSAAEADLSAFVRCVTFRPTPDSRSFDPARSLHTAHVVYSASERQANSEIYQACLAADWQSMDDAPLDHGLTTLAYLDREGSLLPGFEPDIWLASRVLMGDTRALHLGRAAADSDGIYYGTGFSQFFQHRTNGFFNRSLNQQNWADAWLNQIACLNYLNLMGNGAPQPCYNMAPGQVADHAYFLHFGALPERSRDGEDLAARYALWFELSRPRALEDLSALKGHAGFDEPVLNWVWLSQLNAAIERDTGENFADEVRSWYQVIMKQEHDSLSRARFLLTQQNHGTLDIDWGQLDRAFITHATFRDFRDYSYEISHLAQTYIYAPNTFEDRLNFYLDREGLPLGQLIFATQMRTLFNSDLPLSDLEPRAFRTWLGLENGEVLLNRRDGRVNHALWLVILAKNGLISDLPPEQTQELLLTFGAGLNAERYHSPDSPLLHHAALCLGLRNDLPDFDPVEPTFLNPHLPWLPTMAEIEAYLCDQQM